MHQYILYLKWECFKLNSELLNFAVCKSKQLKFQNLSINFFLRMVLFTSHSLKIIVVEKNLFEGALNGKVTFFKFTISWVCKLL